MRLLLQLRLRTGRNLLLLFEVVGVLRMNFVAEGFGQSVSRPEILSLLLDFFPGRLDVFLVFFRFFCWGISSYIALFLLRAGLALARFMKQACLDRQNTVNNPLDNLVPFGQSDEKVKEVVVRLNAERFVEVEPASLFLPHL